MRAAASLVVLAVLGLPTALTARERGYAVWNAASTARAGSEVEVATGEFVERGFLRPAGAIRTRADLLDLDKGKVILPAGAILAAMSGGRAGEYCTWNHGPSLVPPDRRAKLSVISMGGLLCVSVAADQTTTNLHYVSGNNALLLREYGLDFARGAKRVNAVPVETAPPADYPEDVVVGPVFFVGGEKGQKAPCLGWEMRVNGGKPDGASFGSVCYGIGQTAAAGPGRYTLLRWDPTARKAGFRIDQPFQVDDIIPRIIERTSVRIM
ncbi:MAG: hypothetical protein QOG84_1816 [Sphingomonadales bacterium]|jgi:hypothetical protein|nr:hypothetical protein [Sphingomonadales bacterium]